MKKRLAVVVLLASVVWSAAAAGPAGAQLYKEETGPGLDPTPIVIPPFEKKTPRPITTRDLLSIRDLYGVSISPAGDRVAFILGQAVAETNQYRSALYVVGTKPGSVPVSLGTVGRPFWKLNGQWFPEPPSWSPDGKWIAARMNRETGWQVWRWSPEGGAPSQVTHSKLDVQTFRWSKDGSKIVFEVYRPHDEAEVRRMEEGGILFDRDFQAPWDIHMGAVEQKLSLKEVPSETWLHDVASGEAHAASKEEAERESIWVRKWDDLNIVEAEWSPDHSRLAYNKYLDDPKQCATSCYPLFVADRDGKNEKLLTPGVYFAGNPRWSADGKRIYFESRASDGRGATLAAVSVDGGSVRPLLPGGAAASSERGSSALPARRSDCSWDALRTHAACVVENHVTPARVEFVDVERATTRVVVDPNPEFASLRLEPATRIDWPNEHGMFAYLLKPLDYRPGQRYPLVVVTYRSGTHFLRGGVGDEYPIHVFAANGFAVLEFDCGADTNHKHGDFESAMTVWEHPLQGLEIAIRKAAEMGIVDPSRVGFTGLSHGSEIGAFAISHSDLFRAAAMSGSGSWDPEFADMAPPFLAHWFGIWGLVDANGRPDLQRFSRLSATANADRVRAPLLLNVPDREYLTALPFYSALRGRGKPVEMWIYPDEYHEKIQPKHRLSVYDRNVDWFRFWLKGEEDASPAKKDQNERWRKLRELSAKDRPPKS